MDSRATQRCNVLLFFGNLLATVWQLSVFIGQKIRLTDRDNGDNMGDVTCTDSQTVYSPYCVMIAIALDIDCILSKSHRNNIYR